MQYMFLIYNAEGSGPEMGSPAFQEMMVGYQSFTEGVKAAGKFDSGAPLQGIETATTVRVRDGSTQTVDGPFAETKEVLGGYYILDCKDLDEAIAHAAQIPTSKFGSIEIRPVMQM